MIYLTQYKTVTSTAIMPLQDVKFPQRVLVIPEAFAHVETGLNYVPHKVANAVLDPKLLAQLKAQEVGKTAFILAGGNSHFAGTNQKPAHNKLSHSYRFPILTITQIFAGRIAEQCGAQDYVVTDASACASSLKVLMDVYTLIGFYGFARVVVLAVEDSVSNTVLDGLGDLKAVLTLKDEEQGLLPSAFDKQNRGFYVGQGAAFAVFDSWTTLNKTGDQPLAQLCGAYTAAEQTKNSVGQREDGSGYIKAIEGAFHVCKANRDDVKIVKTHGTGTISNNISELTALQSTLKSFVATS